MVYVEPEFKKKGIDVADTEVTQYAKLNYLQRLGITKEEVRNDPRIVKTAYWAIAKNLHPDTSAHLRAKEMFQLLNEAYQVLDHSVLRASYLATLKDDVVVPPVVKDKDIIIKEFLNFDAARYVVHDGMQVRRFTQFKNLSRESITEEILIGMDTEMMMAIKRNLVDNFSYSFSNRDTKKLGYSQETNWTLPAITEQFCYFGKKVQKIRDFGDAYNLWKKGGERQTIYEEMSRLFQKALELERLPISKELWALLDLKYQYIKNDPYHQTISKEEMVTALVKLLPDKHNYEKLRLEVAALHTPYEGEMDDLYKSPWVWLKEDTGEILTSHALKQSLFHMLENFDRNYVNV